MSGAAGETHPGVADGPAEGGKSRDERKSRQQDLGCSASPRGAQRASHRAFSDWGWGRGVCGSTAEHVGEGEGNFRRGGILSRRANVSVEQFKKAK